MEYIITTPCGDVRGVATRREGIIAYKGIRYATAGRFKCPREVTHWDGVYDAVAYGACAYQPRAFYNEEDMPKKVFYYNEFRRGESYTYSEDCLFLNVFAPEKTEERLPVIIYIHGGGYTGGCGHEKHFDEPVWPQKGVIAVTINYRLGPLGFAVFRELAEKEGRAGNYGLYDQLIAILWVKHNIAAFGGDPDNITIMGQSAGAMSVQQLSLSPLSTGLFHKAVMCSGGGVSRMIAVKRAEEHFDFWDSIMEKCGVKSVAEMRALPVEHIFEVWQANKTRSMGGGCSPCIDGVLVVDKEYNVLKRGEQMHIPYMIGSTSEDVVPPFLYSMGKKWCAAQDKPSYLWFFERNLPGDDHGAWHSSDLWYWFGTLDRGWRPFTDHDRELSREMSDRLCAFARTGTPDAEGLLPWIAGGKKALTFGDGETKHTKPCSLKLWHTMLTNHAPGE